MICDRDNGPSTIPCHKQVSDQHYRSFQFDLGGSDYIGGQGLSHTSYFFPAGDPSISHPGQLSRGPWCNCLPWWVEPGGAAATKRTTQTQMHYVDKGCHASRGMHQTDSAQGRVTIKDARSYTTKKGLAGFGERAQAGRLERPW